MLLELPHDILSYILRKLRLNEIGNMHRTCSLLNSFVTNDKQLWLHILERDIISKALPLPKYIRDIDESTAQDVIEWVKNSISLDNSYTSGVDKILIRGNLSKSVTWIKLVRGRWCLIACSDLSESQLVVWDLQTSKAEHHKATFYLPGPIVDGVVEDSRDEILIALTVGTKIASILLLQLYTDGNEVFIHQLLEIPAVSHVRLLKRPYIGFAVRNGDDTNPSILNWETGRLRSFATPDPVQHLAINDPWPLGLKHLILFERHLAAKLLYGEVQFIVLYPGKIVVFSNAGISDQFDDEVLSGSQCIRVHHLKGAYEEFFVLNYDDHAATNGYQDTLRLVLLGDSGFVTNMLIRYDEASKAPGKLVFVIPWGRLELPCLENGYDSEVAKMVVGLTSGRILTLATITHVSWPMPTLYVSQLIPSEERVAFGPCIPLSTEGMPLLYEVTSMDFDDGIGLLVLGKISGDVCVRTFGATLPPSSLASDLPSLQASPDFKVRIPLDLPTIYEVHSSISSQDILEEAFRAWGSIAPTPHLLGWSSDWSQFQNTEQWAVPFPRWGMFDSVANINRKISARVRLRLGTLGEIVPVLFDESNHYRVLFRVGDRLYSCKSQNEDPMADYDEDFDGDVDIIGIFPITFTQFLETSPVAIAELINDRWMQRNIDFDRSSLAARSLLGQNQMFNCVK